MGLFVDNLLFSILCLNRPIALLLNPTIDLVLGGNREDQYFGGDFQLVPSSELSPFLQCNRERGKIYCNYITIIVIFCFYQYIRLRFGKLRDLRETKQIFPG